MLDAWVIFCIGSARAICFSPEASATWSGWTGGLQHVTETTSACSNFTHRAQHVADTQEPIDEDILRHERDDVYALRSRSIQAYGWLECHPQYGPAFLISHMVNVLWPTVSSADVDRAILYRDETHKPDMRYA